MKLREAGKRGARIEVKTYQNTIRAFIVVYVRADRWRNAQRLPVRHRLVQHQSEHISSQSPGVVSLDLSDFPLTIFSSAG